MENILYAMSMLSHTVSIYDNNDYRIAYKMATQREPHNHSERLYDLAIAVSSINYSIINNELI